MSLRRLMAALMDRGWHPDWIERQALFAVEQYIEALPKEREAEQKGGRTFKSLRTKKPNEQR